MNKIKSFLGLCVYSYLATVIAVWAIIWFTGDKWWFGTLLLYGPRWIYALPLLGFVPLALARRHRWLWPLGLTALIVLWPIMGLNVPLDTSAGGKQKALRVLTYNMQRSCASSKELSTLLDGLGVDIAALQGCVQPSGQPPSSWFVAQSDEYTIMSRFPIIRTETSFRESHVNGLYCVINMPDGPIGFTCLDMLTPRKALMPILNKQRVFSGENINKIEQLIVGRWDESKWLSGWVGSFPEEKKIIAGNFNLTVDSNIYRNIWSDYRNAYDETEFGYGHTKRTKINIFNYTARTDHILATDHFRPLRTWTGPDYGSDHLPLLADFALN